MARRFLIGTVVAFAALLGAAAAPAGNNFFVGWTEDLPKLTGSQAVSPGAQLGGKAFRVTLMWSPGQTALTSADTTKLDRAMGAINAAGLRAVLAVYADAGYKAPQTSTTREQYCTYVRNVLRRYPTLRDVVIWNEPNLHGFWNPQFSSTGASLAPAAYQALAARCYDVLHLHRPSVNVIGPVVSPAGWDDTKVAAPTHSPGNFIRKLGEAYRASGRTKPLFDTIGHHAYGLEPSERPWAKHIGNKRIAQGDWNKLMSNLAEAFKGTAQPIPGQMLGTRPVTIWYLEAGFQTRVDAGKTGYYGTENEPGVIPDYAGGEPESPPPAETSPAPDQHTQVLDAIRLAYCQPYVEAYFNFLLFDEGRLEGWQSGAFWFDGTRKDSYGAFSTAIAASNSRTVDCGSLKGGRPSADYTGPAAPANLTAAAAAPTRVNLAWGASTDTESAVAGYRIYRNGSYWFWTAGTSFSDTTVKAATTYSYTVYAEDAAGNLSAVSNKVSVTTPSTDTYAALVLSDNPLAYWRLGERSGSTAADQRGGAPGTYAGGPVRGVPGAPAGDADTAVRLDSPDDFVQIDGAAVALTGAFTLEAWLSHSAIGPIVEYGSDSAYGVLLWAYPSPSDLALNIVDTGGGYHALSAAGVLTPGRWQHVAATYDGRTARLFVDGVEVGSAEVGAVAPNAGGALDLYLGHRPRAGGKYTLLGALDEVAVYRHALAPSRLQAHVARARAS